MVSAAESGGPVVDLESRAPAAPRRKALVVLPLLSTIAVASGVLSYLAGAGTETTDDAQIEGHVAYVAPHVAGQVKRVLVSDNQHVAAGDVLVELDDRDFTAKLDAARADVAAAEASVRAAETNLSVTSKSVESNLVVARGGLAQAVSTQGTTRASIEAAAADVVSAESRVTLARMEHGRNQQLLAAAAVPQATFDSSLAGLEQAEAQLAAARSRLASAEAGKKNAIGTLEAARGRVIAAESGPEQVEAADAAVALAKARLGQVRAALEQAELNEGYTKIRAEVSGVVSRRSVEIGQMASPEKPLLALVPVEDTWVVANFKEDQIARMAAGQAAAVEVDAFSGRELTGHVDSLAAGTGARFSLLPPDNASGNFTKVVQRVPVLIRLEAHPGVELRPGLSAKVSVRTK